MITVRHLTKYFDGKPAISDISTQYSPGECSLVIGASGSGKTVLLKSIIGLLDPDEGEVLFGDVVFNKLPLKEKKATRSQIGMLFQGSALFDFATAQENVMFPLNFFSDMSKSEKLDRANFCLKRVGLENVNDKYPSELSGGMQKRVGIARAIALNPKYLFCDEPNSGLDPQTSVTENCGKAPTRTYFYPTVRNWRNSSSHPEWQRSSNSDMETETQFEIELKGLLRPDRIRLVAVKEISQARIHIYTHEAQETVFKTQAYIRRPLNTGRLKWLVVFRSYQIRDIIFHTYGFLHHTSGIGIECKSFAR